MDQLKSHADRRLLIGCIYCGGPENTREHIPSRVFLDTPYPENLPVIGACRSCNNGFSIDEEYVACFLEAAFVGTTDPDFIRRPGIANILRRTPALQERIKAAITYINGQTHFTIESERLKNIIIKLARGHAAYELSQPLHDDPSLVWWQLIDLMDTKQRDDFEALQIIDTLGEIGSRGTQRLLVVQVSLRAADGKESNIGLIVNDWIDVQEGRYRYHAIEHENTIRIKLVIGNYLACEVAWVI